MNFREIPLEISYKSVGEEAFFDILKPLLKCAKTYKRSVGYFSSSALSFIGEGVIELAKNGGHIYLATSPNLNEEDIDAIKKGYQVREVIKKRFINEFNDALSDISDENAKILFLLIRDGVLDVKIVQKSGGIYHDKLAILEDYDGNVVACVGSNNESGNGYHFNYEKVRVYKSWTDYEGRISDETDEFNSIWSSENKYLEVYDFMDAVNQCIVQRVEHTGPFSQHSNGTKYKIRDYQEEAKDNWIKNGHKGFYVMATGTGKTVTALYSVKELIEKERIFTIIAVPYKHLVNQWYEDVVEFFPNADVYKVHGEIPNAETRIFSSFLKLRESYKPIIVVTTIVSFFLERYKNLYDRIDMEKLLIVDEAHNFVNKISDELQIEYKYRLGLSATPVFGKDVEKTKMLLDWFGGIVEDLPIEKALGKYLVNYEYHPIFVKASSEDEEKFAKATSLMMSAIDLKSGKIIDEQKFTLGYRGRLRAISMAEEKIKNIQDIFDNVKETDHVIVYCSDGRMFFDNKNGDSEEIRHLEYILKLINGSIISRDQTLKASKFTATENVDVRMQLIDSFNKGLINYLVAIRCLDEGINIPSIKSALILSSNDNYREFVQRRGRILRTYDDGNTKKEKADIYDVIVLPSIDNKLFAEIELRRYHEYCKLAVNNDEQMKTLEQLLDKYDLTYEDISFNNEFITGGDLDE